MAQGNTTNPWMKSKALLGSLSNIERTRVSELQNPEPEKPLAPHWRAWNSCRNGVIPESEVQQRGIGACQGIVSQLLEGIEMDAQQPVLLVDLLPSRFAEWSHACWEMLKPTMLGQNPDAKGSEMHNIAIYVEDDNDMMQDSMRSIAGKIMSQWWDVSMEAGGKSRPNAQFAVDPPTLKVVTVSQDGKAMHLGL